jgi:ADP-ribosylglycohydrolase
MAAMMNKNWPFKFRRIFALVCLSVLMTNCQALAGQTPLQTTYRRLPVSEYRNKMMAGWLGQMVGVSYGSPTEFRYLDKTIPSVEIPKIYKGIANQSFGQDDLYVEMTFLRTLETYGLDVTSSQAGLDFARSEYPLWHANSAGRMNLRSGIAPPDSGNPAYNPHADDIDYQIEADFAGLISPGLPNQAIALGETFGRLMNYGDGLYGGQFFSCMYSEAFFESTPEKLVEAGLACIPAKSQYAEAVHDVLNWWRENPQDWQLTWEKIQAKYQHNPDYRRYSCSDMYFDDQFNIDAKMNGAYVVMGLLYGTGDPLASMTIAMRGGQDSDCNPASAGGVVFTTKGIDHLPPDFSENLNYNKKWDYTEYNFTRLIDVCEKLARQAVLKAGGKIETGADGEEVFVIPVQKPRSGPLEQSWNPAPIQKKTYSESELESINIGSSRLAQATPRFAPGWRVTSCVEDFLLGLKENVNGRAGVLMVRSGDWMPCTLVNRATLPADKDSYLHLEVGSIQGKTWTLVVRANGSELLRQEIGQSSTPDRWFPMDVNLTGYRGKTVQLEVVDVFSGENAYGLFSGIAIGERNP